MRWCTFAWLWSLFIIGCRQELKGTRDQALERSRPPSGSYVLQHGNRPRRYHVHLPKMREHEVKLPLVIALHGAPGHGANMAEFSGLRELADSKGFIAVFPDGTSAQDPVFLNWNSGTCCGYAHDNSIDDVGFLRRLIEQLIAQYQADKNRVYMTGFSKGGMMAYYFACRQAELLAGIAVVAGAFNLSDCHPARSLAVLIVHGRADAAIPYGGEMPLTIGPLRETENRPVSSAVHFWRKVNECQHVVRSAYGQVEITDFDCLRSPLRLISLRNEGHTWPGAADGHIGAEKPRGQFSVAEAIWSFWQGIP